MSLQVSLVQFAATESEGGIDALGVDPIAILIQGGTFVLLFLIVKKYALSSMTEKLDERRKKIEEGLRNAEKVEKRVAEAHEETEAMLKKARKEADDIIAKSHQEAGELIKEAEIQAGKKAENLVKDAEARIEHDIAKAKKELKGELLELVADATETVLGEKIDAAKDKQLIEKALSKK